MDLQELYILHIPKKDILSNDTDQEDPNEGSNRLARLTLSLDPNILRLETCQRWLFISSSVLDLHSHSKGSLNLEGFRDLLCPAVKNHSQLYLGTTAYQFLLKLSCGLESEILGETDVFGQVKEAWRQFEASGSLLVHPLRHWIQKLFEDTKEIRSQYLQNLGGTSYGALVRKLIRSQAAELQTKMELDTKSKLFLPSDTFLIGAGQIAHSVAPFLTEGDLYLWNRSIDKINPLYENLSKKVQASRSSQKPASRISILESEEAGWRGESAASHIVICTPFDKDLDHQRLAWMKQRIKPIHSVIHLGGTREEAGPWKEIPRFYCLSDLYSLQDSLQSVRSVQVSRAIKACEQKAKLRSLNLSICVQCESIDMATFA